MSNQQILYEAKLATVGRKLTWAGFGALVLWLGFGLTLCFSFDSFPSNIGALLVIAFGALVLSLLTVRVLRLRKNSGIYRVSIDDQGVYVHSDDPSSAPSFSVIAPDLHRLVRKAIKVGEGGDEHEYYIEIRSGTRHRIDQLFSNYDLDVMGAFETIAERFPWVRVVEEANQ
jgi:hypothetical protein